MLTGSNVHLAAFDSQHATKTRVWLNDEEICLFLGRTRPISDVEQEQWFNNLHKNESCTYFAIVDNQNKKHLGNIWLYDINPRNRSAEVRVVLDKTIAGRGLGSEALSLIAQYGFNWLNLHKLYAYVLAPNVRAMKAFEKAGFQKEAILEQDRWINGQFVDVVRLKLFNSQWTAPQKPED